MTFRRNGISCEIDFLERSLKSQMREADRQKAEFVIIIGENELRNDHVSVKNMKTGNQTIVMIKDLVNHFLCKEGKDEPGNKD